MILKRKLYMNVKMNKDCLSQKKRKITYNNGDEYRFSLSQNIQCDTKRKLI